MGTLTTLPVGGGLRDRDASGLQFAVIVPPEADLVRLCNSCLRQELKWLPCAGLQTGSSGRDQDLSSACYRQWAR